MYKNIIILVLTLVISNLGVAIDFFKEDTSSRVIVSSSKAIIYADEGLKNPIGYISNGKYLTVGQPLKKNNEILPLIISGRLAYVEAKDVSNDNSKHETVNFKRGAPKEHNINILIDTPEEKLSENNSVYFFLQSFSGGQEVQQLFETVDEQSKSNILGYGINLIHRKENSKLLYGAGYEYNNISTDAVKFNYFLLSPLIGYTPFKSQLFLVDIIASYDFSVGAELKIENNSKDEPSAFLHGPSFQGRVVFFPFRKYHFTGSLGYHNYTVTSPTDLFDQNDVRIPILQKVQGIFLSIGLGIEFY